MADNYYTAMRSVERRLDLVEKPEEPAVSIRSDERQRLLTMAEALSEPALSLESRLEITACMCKLLNGDGVVFQERFLERSPPI